MNAARRRAAERTLVARADLLAAEAQLVTEQSINWRGRLRQLGNYGFGGGSAGDRRLIVEYLATLEAEHRHPITH